MYGGKACLKIERFAEIWPTEVLGGSGSLRLSSYHASQMLLVWAALGCVRVPFAPCPSACHSGKNSLFSRAICKPVDHKFFKFACSLSSFHRILPFKNFYSFSEKVEGLLQVVPGSSSLESV